MDSHEQQKKYFAALKAKYQANKYPGAAFENFLYLILRKAELHIPINTVEHQWLEKKRLFETLEIIQLQQNQSEDQKRLESEVIQLRQKYHVPEALKLTITDSVCSILYKVDGGELNLTNFELQELEDKNLIATIALIQEVQIFSSLKLKYQATQHTNQIPEEPLYSILKKLDRQEELSDIDLDWLAEFKFEETIKIFWEQESKRKECLKFLKLKAKYKVDTHPDTSTLSPLYWILKNLDAEQELSLDHCHWLRQEKLNVLLEIDQKLKDTSYFAKLKVKYKATQEQNSDPSCRLFSVLRNLEESQVSEMDIQWLKEQGLTQILEVAKKVHFRRLKEKYRLVGQLAIEPFYEIMLKLERQERLDPKQVVQLIEEDQLSPHGKIAIAYYRLEALFYEQEHKRTGNLWKLPSASSFWRKADEPQNALKVTETVNWSKVHESKLKAALWVTRGAAFRDLGQLNEAEKCATQAKDCHPESYQPYTLLGAIYYGRGEYPEGDNWFAMAEERGASARDVDDEIKRIVRMEKDKAKRKEVVEYLLQKDPVRYAWASAYQKEVEAPSAKKSPRANAAKAKSGLRPNFC